MARFDDFNGDYSPLNIKLFTKNLTEIEYRILRVMLDLIYKDGYTIISFDEVSALALCHSNTVLLIFRRFCSLGILIKLNRGFKKRNFYKFNDFMHRNDVQKAISDTFVELGLPELLENI